MLKLYIYILKRYYKPKSAISNLSIFLVSIGPHISSNSMEKHLKITRFACFCGLLSSINFNSLLLPIYINLYQQLKQEDNTLLSSAYVYDSLKDEEFITLLLHNQHLIPNNLKEKILHQMYTNIDQHINSHVIDMDLLLDIVMNCKFLLLQCEYFIYDILYVILDQNNDGYISYKTFKKLYKHYGHLKQIIMIK